MKRKCQFPVSLWEGRLFSLMSSLRNLMKKSTGNTMVICCWGNYSYLAVMKWKPFLWKKRCLSNEDDGLPVQRETSAERDTFHMLLFRKYKNLFRKQAALERLNRSAPWISLASLPEKVTHHFSKAAILPLSTSKFNNPPRWGKLLFWMHCFPGKMSAFIFVVKVLCCF